MPADVHHLFGAVDFDPSGILRPMRELIAHADVAYMAVFAWGLVAIAVRQWNIPELAIVALGLVAIDSIVLAVSLGHRRTANYKGL